MGPFIFYSIAYPLEPQMVAMVVAKNPAQSRKKTPSKANASDPASSNYTVGCQISHPMFGDGTVTAIDGDKLTIEFEGNVMKQILDHYVKLRKP